MNHALSVQNSRPSADRCTTGKVLFITNPNSGRYPLVRQFLRQGAKQLWGWEMVVTHPRSQQEAESICNNLDAKDYRAVFILGGDGTFHYALPGLIKAKIPAGILPAGTANDLARQLGLSMDWDLIQDLLDQQRVDSIDLITMNGIPFATIGGIGLGARVIQHFNRLRESSALVRRALGVMKSQAYTALAGATLFSDPQLFRRIRIQGQGILEEVRTGCILVANQTSLGGDMIIAPGAQINDGKFDVVVFLARKRRDLLKAMADLKNRRTPPDIMRFQTAHLVIEDLAGQSLAGFGDGELLVDRPRIEIGVHPGAISVFHAQAIQGDGR